MTRRHDERGQTTLLIAGFFLVVALTVGVAVDASAAYLQRQGLANLADGAALAAADGVKAEQVYTGALDRDTAPDPRLARRYAERYLAETGAAGRYHGLRLTLGVAGGTVTVRLTAPLDLPIAPPGWEDRPTVSAAAAAYVRVSD